MNTILLYIQMAVAILLVAVIAIQQRGAALGSAFGGGGEFYSARRGIQKNLYYATIALSAIFLALGVLILYF